jgi:hypothetical protein
MDAWRLDCCARFDRIGVQVVEAVRIDDGVGAIETRLMRASEIRARSDVMLDGQWEGKLGMIRRSGLAVECGRLQSEVGHGGTARLESWNS